MEIDRILPPVQVDGIIRQLNEKGFEAFLVGGCVRDSILGTQPSDWDIATNALPEQVKALFHKTVDTGIRHGTVTVIMDGTNYEVTTYRIEGDYKDYRRPSQVRFSSSLEDDLGRRDFTVNAIAWHPRQGYVDPFGGLKDLPDKIIRAVGSPDERFREDALRMLRAVRFSAQLDFSIEEKTFHSIQKYSSLIKHISGERIREEMTKILMSSDPLKFSLLEETGLLQFLLPEFVPAFRTDQDNPYHIYNVAMHTLKAVSYIKKDRNLRWAMLLHDIGKPYVKTVDKKGVGHFYGHSRESVKIAEKVLKRLRFDNKSMERIVKLVDIHDRNIEAADSSIRKHVNRLGVDLFADWLLVKEADNRAQNPVYLDERLEKLNRVRQIFQEIVEKNECFSLKSLAINGDDLIAMGYKPGKKIKEILNGLLEAVMDKPEKNMKEILAELARQLHKK